MRNSKTHSLRNCQIYNIVNYGHHAIRYIPRTHLLLEVCIVHYLRQFPASPQHLWQPPFCGISMSLTFFIFFLIFWGTSMLFSTVAASSTAQGFPFLHVLTNTCYFLLTAILTSVRWLSPCGFDLHFPAYYALLHFPLHCVEHLSLICWPFVCLL